MHSHQHHHQSGGNSLGWAFFLNVAFAIIEFIGGILTNSTAIMADAVHDLGDSLAIGLAWLLNRLSAKQPSETYSYGFQRLTLFGALFNGIVLLLGSIWVLYEAIPRLFNPVMPVAEGMFALAILGIVVNGYTAYKLQAGKTLNEKVLTWHLLEDLLGWVAVLIVSIVLIFVELPILDPVLSIGFTLFILINVLRNLKGTIALFLQAAPEQKMQSEIKQQLVANPQVADIHHLHFWSLDGERHVLTAHLELKENMNVEQLVSLKQKIADALSSYPLSHTTIEFEFPDETCRDRDEQ